jgi:NTE family protein
MKKGITIFCLLVSMIVFSQKNQPKVGLVLSGGGAKGFAHVGVLKAIEKSGIQIDYIGGTSMGAIVGGLYASGYSVLEIEKIIIETDFYALLQDINPRRSKPFFEKENGEKHAIVLPVNDGKIGLPKGVSKGQNILNFLTELLSPVDTISDFSKLPIPFFCIATDVETGNQVKLTKGFLPLALRASGSFPTLLNPIEIDHKLLIDGAVANNFPVDEMQKTGVDIIIGVDVQDKLFKKDNIKSALDLLNQISSYQMYKKMPEQISNTDVYIHPEIFDYSVVSFDKSKEILKKGIDKGLEFMSVFDSISKLQTHKKPVRKITKTIRNFVISTIEINGNNNHTRAYVLGKLKIKEGDSISRLNFSKSINYLSSTDNFQIIDYNFIDEGSDKKLILNVKESSQNATVRLGLHYDFVYKSGVLLNYNHKNFLIKNDALSLDLVVGDRLRYNLEYFVDNGFYYSYGFSSRFNNFRENIKPVQSSNVSKIDLQYTDFTNTVYLQTTFDRKFAFGLGLEHKNLTLKTETITNADNTSFVFDESDYFNAFSYLKLDTYDDINYPTKGVNFDASFRWYLWSSDFNNDFVQFSQVKGKLGFAKTFFDDFTFQYISEGGFTLGEVTSTSFDFLLGGYNKNFINNFVSFYGYDINALSNQSFLKSLINIRYKVFKNNYISFLANYARVAENVLKKGDLFVDTKSGYAFGYSVDTLIGPIDLKYSWSPDTKNHFWYFNLGFWF